MVREKQSEDTREGEREQDRDDEGWILVNKRRAVTRENKRGKENGCFVAENHSKKIGMKSYIGTFRKDTEVFKKIEAVAFSVFVDNLPISMTKSWLWQIFDKNGKVIDIFLSRKQRSYSQMPFAFVRYASRHDTNQAITDRNGMEIRGNKIVVKESKYRRNEKNQSNQAQLKESSKPEIAKGQVIKGSRMEVKSFKDAVIGTEYWREKQSNSDRRQAEHEATKNPSKPDQKIIIQGEEDSEMAEQLSRSIIGSSTFAFDICSIKQRMCYFWDQISQIRQLGTFKTLITFVSKEDMDEILINGKDFLLEFFADVKRWDENQIADSRNVWLEVFCLPLHAWSTSNLAKIGEIWGNFLGSDATTNNKQNFSMAKILVATDNPQFIEGRLVTP